jgi:plasmid stabilization system protein ParE
LKNAFCFTPQARSDLKQILLDIAENSPDRARALCDEFYTTLQTLGRNPGIGDAAIWKYCSL